jgi:GTPase SAR1 family protein
VLVGNKCDLTTREVEKSEGEELAKTWGVPFFETSAKTKTNNEVCFYELVTLMKNARKVEAKPAKKRACTIL